MRLNRLDLTRYGRFTDLSVDFGPVPGDGPDLHVIYGPNEAGKSTLLTGWLDLLFQIPARSTMDFLHPYATMQLGAELAIDGRTQQVVRVKGNKNTLHDGHNTPIGEALLQAGLRGLDRESYSRMFSLNGQTLIEGGESILASKGDLGQLLFSASAGLADLAGRLDGLRAEAETFLSASGRKGRLVDLKAELDALGTRMRELDFAASDHAKLVQARDNARSDHDAATTQVEAARRQVIQLDRMIGALPLAGRLRRLQDEIAGFGDLPMPPPAWIADLPALDRHQTGFSTRIDTATRQISDMTAELDQIVPDTAVLSQAGAIAAAERLKSGFDTALDDLPKRIGEREGFDAAIASRLRRLGQEGTLPETLLPPARTLATLRALIETRSGVETALTSAETEAETARRDHEEARQALEDSGGGDADTEALGRLVGQLRRDDPQGALDRARSISADEAALLDDALQALRPWTGTAADLASIASPDAARPETLRSALVTATRDLERSADTLARLRAETTRAEARAGAAGGGASVTLAQAAEIRAARETAWTHHRGVLDGDTADDFERAMRLDDQASAALAEARAEAEKTADAAEALAQLRAQLDIARGEHAQAETRLADLRADLAALVRQTCPALPETTDPDGFTVWLGRLDSARAQAAKAGAAERLAATRAGLLGRATEDLRAALAQAGSAPPPDAGYALLLETAQALLDRGAAIAQRRKAVTEAKAKLARRVAALDKARAAEAGWAQKWADACADTWMMPPPGAAGMGAILDELAGLEKDIDERRKLESRIAKMELNRDRFADAVAAIAAALDLAPGPDPATVWGAIKTRQSDADKAENTRARLRDKRDAAVAALDELERDADLHRRRVDEIAAFFGLSDWPDIRAALDRAGARAGLIRDRDICAGDLCDRLHAADAETALALVQDKDAAELQARAQTVRAELDELDGARQDAHARLRVAETALSEVGGDDEVARLEARRQTLLLQIADGARTHLRHRLGLLAVDHALRRYRDTHRSGMLQRASDAFRVMSRGRYDGLAAQPDGDGEVLVALAADGGSKRAGQLSDGTRGQLYLALRIAGYHEFAASKGAVPFIADDIMESFDDDRTAEALKLLAETSRSGQVIYLTHHAHVCEIAGSVCPGVRMHRLED